MTAIAALVTPAGVYLACDSLTDYSGVHRHVDKLIRRGRWTFTLAGDGQVAGWLQHEAPLQGKEEADAAYLYRVSLQLDQWARTHGNTITFSDGTTGPHVSVFAACSAGAWTVTAGGGVLPIERFIAAGDGTAVTAAFLASERCGLQPLQALHAAMEVAAEVCPGVGGPLQVVRMTAWGAEPVAAAGD